MDNQLSASQQYEIEERQRTNTFELANLLSLAADENVKNEYLGSLVRGYSTALERTLLSFRRRCWLSVEKAMPTDDAPVLIAYLPAFHKSTKGGRKRSWSITVARYSGGKWRFIIPSQKSRLSERVKYWQPGPSAPLTPLPQNYEGSK